MNGVPSTVSLGYHPCHISFEPLCFFLGMFRDSESWKIGSPPPNGLVVPRSCSMCFTSCIPRIVEPRWLKMVPRCSKKLPTSWKMNWTSSWAICLHHMLPTADFSTSEVFPDLFLKPWNKNRGIEVFHFHLSLIFAMAHFRIYYQMSYVRGMPLCQERPKTSKNMNSIIEDFKSLL